MGLGAAGASAWHDMPWRQRREVEKERWQVQTKVRDSLGRALEALGGESVPFASGLSSSYPNVMDLVDTEDLADRCVPATCGRGEATVMDDTVRQCLVSEDVVVDWPDLDEAVEEAGRQLGTKRTLTGRFHQLILYQEGDFFRRHRDAKKGQNHVATLSVDLGNALPREGHWEFNDGGHRIDFDDSSWTSDGPGSWCCWYNSDFHEIRPCDDTRIVAIYNVYEEEEKESDGTMEATTNVGLQDALAEAQGLAAEYGFRYAGVLMEHTYSFDGAESLAIESLRGRDRVIAEALAAAAHSDRLTAVPAHALAVTLLGPDYLRYRGYYSPSPPGPLRRLRIAAAVEEFYPSTRDASSECMDKMRTFSARYGGAFDPGQFANIDYDDFFPLFSVPFRDTVWTHAGDSRAVRLLRMKDPNRAHENLWGNEAQFSIYSYRQTALLVDLLAVDADEAHRAAADFYVWQQRRSSSPPVGNDPIWYAADISE